MSDKQTTSKAIKKLLLEPTILPVSRGEIAATMADVVTALVEIRDELRELKAAIKAHTHAVTP